MPRDYKRALRTMPAAEPVAVLNSRMVAHG
jgi:hypothetical protein